MEINVGDYVRDKNGRVGKVFDITNEPSVDVGIGIIPEVNAVWIDKDKINYLYQEDITKHSKDIIDLIEEDDYIRIITSSHFDYVYMSYGKLVIRDDVPIENYSNKFIAEILTKEQIKANAYTIEKER